MVKVKLTCKECKESIEVGLKRLPKKLQKFLDVHYYRYIKLEGGEGE